MTRNQYWAMRAVALAVLILAVGVSVYYFTRSSPPLPTVSSGQEPSQVNEPMVPANPSSSTPYTIGQPVALEQAPVTFLEPESKGMTGTWELRVLDEQSGKMDDLFRIDLDDRSGELEVASVEIDHNLTVLLNGYKLTLSSHRDNYFQTFEGTLNLQKTEAQGHYMTGFQDNADQSQHTDTSDAVLVLLSPSFLEQESDAEELVATRLNEAQMIFDAIHAFAIRNGAKFPSALSQIPISSFPDPALIAHVPGRTITYSGGSAVLDNERLSEIKPLAVDKLSTEFLVEHERQLREVWGGETPSASPLLRIHYTSPPLTIDIATTGVMSVSDTSTAEAAASIDPSELRSLEYNNLKQLALIVKMFQSENNDFIPPGWLTVYPEYLADTDLLRSPWTEDRAPSYQLLNAGAHQDDLRLIAQELRDSGMIEVDNAVVNPELMAVQLDSHIPVIAGTNLLPAISDSPPARAVAFLDGHVEAVRIEDWNRRIAPFLQ